MRIFEGLGKQYDFSFSLAPRVWNGTIYYDPLENAVAPAAEVPEPLSIAIVGLGLTGLALARRRPSR
ncbi:PEP-CTERM sorting domain-containing protein [Pseudoduganella sp. UC29_106]|uniref:PEP-CTERM sorting domain-containing protein n=1 Tax=Pseudoduganella sp. UC29_106 TaxID=3374553 RepID=UPI003756FF23